MLTYFLLLAGFVLLIKGADFLVVGATSIAKKFNISDMVIGLTIVSMGTSLPELIVNVLASLKGDSGIATGNIIGSNIANILLILGVAAIIYPLRIKRDTVFKELPYSLIAVLLTAFLANAALGREKSFTGLDTVDGIILLLFFLLFMIYVFVLTKEGKSNITEELPEIETKITKSVVMLVGGIIALFFGGKWVVESASSIAADFGLSNELIGLTVVSIGTSLPELVTSAMAAYRKNTDIAVANVIGSNIFNLLWILGLSAVIRPIPFDLQLNVDLLFLVFSSTVIVLSLLFSKKKTVISWPSGVLYLLLYAAYITYITIRG